MRISVRTASKFLNTNEDHIRLLASEGDISKVVDGKIDLQSIVDYQWGKIFDRRIMHDAIRDYHGF